MRRNLCPPVCECGAELQFLLEQEHALRQAGPSRAALLRDAARWPELEAMESALANYDEAA